MSSEDRYREEIERNKLNALGGTMGKQAQAPYADCETPVRMVGGPTTNGRSVHQRIYEALRAGERAANCYNAALRAKEILSKHPEFAELLDALNEL